MSKTPSKLEEKGKYLVGGEQKAIRLCPSHKAAELDLSDGHRIYMAQGRKIDCRSMLIFIKFCLAKVDISPKTSFSEMETF